MARGDLGTIYESFVYVGGSSDKIAQGQVGGGWHLAFVKIDTSGSAPTSSNMSTLAYATTDCNSGVVPFEGYPKEADDAPYISHMAFTSDGSTSQLFGLF